MNARKLNAQSSATRPDVGGPVSAYLLDDLTKQTSHHGIVLWLDSDGTYTAFAERLASAANAAALPFAFARFTGSFLTLMLELESVASGLAKPQLVVYLPGFNEQRVHESPLLELYRAGIRHRYALSKLIVDAASGRVAPEPIEAFRAGNPTLEDADDWMRSMVEGQGHGLAHQLRAVSPLALVRDLNGDAHRSGAGAGAGAGAHIRTEVASDETGANAAAVRDHLGAVLGLPKEWPPTTAQTIAADGDSAPRDTTPADLTALAVGWALCVEYVDDLKRDPVAQALAPATTLPAAFRATCRELAVALRTHEKTLYKRIALQTETLLDAEVRAAQAEDLGEVDTFRFEEERVYDAALDALDAGAWQVAADWAKARLSHDSYWLDDDIARRNGWTLMAAAAALGLHIDRCGDGKQFASTAPAGLAAWADVYAEQCAAVDRAHRELEQHRRTHHKLHGVVAFDRLRAVLDDVRGRWQRWADDWAEAFTVACERHGWLPEAGLQQRTLFDDVVRPCTARGTTALFLVDALRFEMAQTLVAIMAAEPNTTVSLRPRLAELPSVTEVGMNALAPMARGGRLSAHVHKGKFAGFSTGEFRVNTRALRVRAMRERVGGNACPGPTMAEVLASDAKALRRSIAQAKLIVVHAPEIDEAGEAGLGLKVFDEALQHIVNAWKLLREAGVQRFVITADHGFLLLYGGDTAKVPHGPKHRPKHRHIITEHAEPERNTVCIPLSKLGYDVEGDRHVSIPRNTARFEKGELNKSFVHGGNSLQERVIPVLTVEHRGKPGSLDLSYRVRAKPQRPVADLHVLTATVTPDAQSSLEFASADTVMLALRAVDPADATVDVIDVRHAPRKGGVIHARVGKEFEVFFRVERKGETETRAQVELYHPGTDVKLAPFVVRQRFAVKLLPKDDRDNRDESSKEATSPDATEVAKSKENPSIDMNGWIADLPDAVRPVFEHLNAHGAVTEAELYTILGNARAVRKFTRAFDDYAAQAPYELRITVTGTEKRYIKHGGAV